MQVILVTALLLIKLQSLSKIMSRIELQTLTPSVYYNQSRDFQYIGRLFDIVLNSVKMNADMLYNIPLSENSDEKLTDLMAMTLGLKLKHKYPAKQLTAICSCFSEIMRNKGSLYAVELAVNALLNAEGLTKEYKVDMDVEKCKLTIYVPFQLSDTSLLRDIMDYILPAGVSCSICILNFTSATANTKLAITSAKQYDTINEYSTLVDSSKDYSAANIYDNRQQEGYIGTSMISKPEEDK